MSLKLKCHQEWKVTKTEMSPKKNVTETDISPNGNVTKTEMSLKLKCYQF